ncbi:acyltransferase family protein [Corynebacterium pseudopelargi]|uniref:O-acetyltransferase OatA n=1 Tax=Corynebacterium pseudopelargi TaxID=2080757 RepID=A0A3G6IVY7_9CORY|nr:acyltransferase family protein [Corynebacterium pseudopelargi]AZA09941.1 O-acetyltransferase OatA [Corynebacterium pseudopelargi]
MAPSFFHANNKGAARKGLFRTRRAPRLPMTVEAENLGGQPIGKKIRRVPGIDGLRGIAVLAVVIYHFAAQLLPGGYLGVDVFFVLSGFLITSLLLREYAATGAISLKDFWVRRLRRIVPAATMVLLITVPITRLFGGNLAVGLDKQFFGSVLFVNNWVQIANDNTYFGQDQVQIFAHYWSLAVEEQFYILFPPIVVGLLWLLRRYGRRSIRPVLMAVFLFGAALSATWMAIKVEPGQDPTRVYYGTDTHAFGLLIGAALAALLTSTSSKARDSWPRHSKTLRKLLGIFGVIAFALLLWQMWAMGDDLTFTYRGGLVAASVLTAIVLAAVVFEVGPISRLMELAPLRWLGERSFSLYLWHWPIIQLLRHWFPEQPWQLLAILAVAVSLPLSAWSYRNIETPIRRGGYLKAAKRRMATLTSPDLRPIRAWITTVLAVLILPSATIASLVTAPDKTDLERFLDQAASQQQKAEAAETTKPKPVRVMPKGNQISAVGDSVMLASADVLRTEFPGIYVDGEVSRALVTAKAILQQMIADGTLDQFVVLGFGTNSQVDDELMDEVMEVLGPDRIVVITEPYGDRPWIPYSREAILKAAKRYSNLYVAPWCQAVASDPLILRDDGIHPTPDGALVYADTIRDAFKQWKDDKKVIPSTCG